MSVVADNLLHQAPNATARVASTAKESGACMVEGFANAQYH